MLVVGAGMGCFLLGVFGLFSLAYHIFRFFLSSGAPVIQWLSACLLI